MWLEGFLDGVDYLIIRSWPRVGSAVVKIITSGSQGRSLLNRIRSTADPIEAIMRQMQQSKLNFRLVNKLPAELILLAQA